MSSEETTGAAEIGHVVVGRGVVLIQDAPLLAAVQRLAELLPSALETRAVIDQATGITMSRTGGTEAEALDRLRALSQTRHQTLAVVARGVVEEAVGLARTSDH